jgi:hypothetical protein
MSPLRIPRRVLPRFPHPVCSQSGRRATPLALIAPIAPIAPITLVTLVTLVTLFLTPRLVGQGTGGAFPDPVCSATLERFGVLLGLSPQERAEMGSFHEAYLAQVRELREGPIAEWLKNHSSTGLMFGSSRPREELEQAVRAKTQILAQMEKAERELLDRMAAGLPPEQAERMARVRGYAARERARGSLGSFGGGALVQVELRELVDRLELDESLRAVIEEPLGDYERRLTRLLAGMADRAVQQPLAVRDALASAGLSTPQAVGVRDDGAPEAPAAAAARLEEHFRESARVRAEVTAPQREAKLAIAKLSRESLGRLRSALPAEQGALLADAFMRQAYAQVAGDERPAGALINAARRKAESMPGGKEKAESLALLHGSWRSAYDAVQKELMDEVDAHQAKGDGMAIMLSMGDREQLAEFEERLDAIRAKRRAVNEGALAQATGVLGQESAAELGLDREPLLREAEIRESAIMVLDGAEGLEILELDGEGLAVAFTGSGGPDGPGAGQLPQPLSRRELEAMGAFQGLDELMRPVVDVIHEDYEANYQRNRDEAMAELRRADPAGESSGEPSGGAMAWAMPRPMDAQSIGRRYASFAQGVERLAQVDREFFDALQAVLQSTSAAAQIPGARSARERDVLRRAAKGPGGPMLMGLGGAGGREAELDVEAVAGNLPSARRAEVQPILIQYAQRALIVARQHYEIALAAQKEVDLFHAKAMKLSEGGRVEVSIDSNDDTFAAMEEAQRKIAEAAAQVAAINRAARDEILAALPEGERQAFSRAYARAAWPGVYRDHADARKKLESAMALSDLSDERLAQIRSLLAEHSEAYETLCDRMVEVEQATGVAGLIRDGEAMRALSARQNEIRKLRFERSERNATTLRALGGLLTAEQIDRIGGVAMPAAKRPGAAARPGVRGAGPARTVETAREATGQRHPKEVWEVRAQVTVAVAPQKGRRFAVGVAVDASRCLLRDLQGTTLADPRDDESDNSRTS